MEDIRLFVQQEIMNIAFKKVGFNESLVGSKLLDSISLVDLLVAIEEKTGKIIPQHLINEENFDTIEKIITTIENL